MNSSPLPAHFKAFEARPAATMLLLRDDPFRVLVVKRSARSFFPSAIVFPGGMVDQADHDADWHDYLTGHDHLTPADRALRIAAARETWEEAAIPAPCRAVGQLPADHGENPFRAHLRQLGMQLDLAAMIPFSQWITPPQLERRYDTHMFIARAPADAEALCDGNEIISCEWLEPKAAVERAHAGDDAILFSTYFNMCLLAQASGVDAALDMTLARPIVPIIPQRLDDDEGQWIKIRDDAGYPVTRAPITPAMIAMTGGDRQADDNAVQEQDG